jgi:hypothetical protein
MQFRWVKHLRCFWNLLFVKISYCTFSSSCPLFVTGSENVTFPPDWTQDSNLSQPASSSQSVRPKRMASKDITLP